jgi:thiamine biosynthesis lipoprotein
MQTYVIAFRAMGSQVNVWLETGEDGTVILQQVPGWLEDIEAVLSRFRPTSELSYLNRQVGKRVTVSDIMCTNIAQALMAARLTGGLVTPLVLRALVAAGYDRSFEMLQGTVTGRTEGVPLCDWEGIQLNETARRVWLPDQIDLGGTAKGWSAQLVANRLAGYGAALVDLGGDIVGRGKPWAVQLHDPFQPDTPFTTLTLHDEAVATSGTDYRRWGTRQHHIIDPRTGIPADTDVVSATVIHPDAVLAETFAKAVLLQGSRAGLSWLAQQPQTAGAVFDREGRVLATENFQTHIQQGA